MNSHLTDEQFTELLCGDAPFEANRHLADCAQCQTEFQRLREALSDFASLGLYWAEKRASESISAPSAIVRNWPSIATGAAAVVTLAAAVLFAVQQEGIGTADAPGAVSQQSDYVATVAADDRLMVAIDREIQQQTEAAVSNVDFAGQRFAAQSELTHTHSSHGLTN